MLLSLARPLRRALRGECPYFIYGSRVQRLAAQNMDYVRLELDHNQRLKADYGDLKTDGREEEWVRARTDPHCKPWESTRTRWSGGKRFQVRTNLGLKDNPHLIRFGGHEIGDLSGR